MAFSTSSFSFSLDVFADPPDIAVEKSWVHSGEGFEAQLVCIVHADPQPTVSIILELFILSTLRESLLRNKSVGISVKAAFDGLRLDFAFKFFSSSKIWLKPLHYALMTSFGGFKCYFKGMT